MNKAKVASRDALFQRGEQETGKSPKVLILGYGRLGRAFSRLYGTDYDIRGVRRTPADLKALSPILQMPIQSEWLLPHLQWASVIIFCPASGRKDLAVYRETYLGNMQFVLHQMKISNLGKTPIVLISSTGVYPRLQGGTWDETMQLPIETAYQEVLFLTEQALIKSTVPYVILRAGGIYGENRGYLHRVRQRGTVYTSEMSERFVTSVHEDDLCGVIHQVIAQNITGETYNVADETNMQKREWAEAIAQKTGLPIESDGPPPFASERKISTEKLKRHLGYRFLYPTAPLFLESLNPSFSGNNDRV